MEHAFLVTVEALFFRNFVTYILDGNINKKTPYIYIYDGFGGLGVACWHLIPKFAGSNPAEGRKNPQHAFLRSGSKARKRSLNLRGSRNLGKVTIGHLSRPQFHLSLLGSLASLRTEAPGS